jgi:hypothetical protein
MLTVISECSKLELSYLSRYKPGVECERLIVTISDGEVDELFTCKAADVASATAELTDYYAYLYGHRNFTIQIFKR